MLSDNSDDTTSRKAASPQDLWLLPRPVRAAWATSRATCYLAVGRYVAQMSGTDLHDVQQQTSAQYLLLKQI